MNKRPDGLSPELNWCEYHGGYDVRAFGRSVCPVCFDFGRKSAQRNASALVENYADRVNASDQLRDEAIRERDAALKVVGAARTWAKVPTYGASYSAVMAATTELRAAIRTFNALTNATSPAQPDEPSERKRT